MSITNTNFHPTSNHNTNPSSHDDLDDEKTSTLMFGFWIFLMSDLIFFGVMFAIYITMIGATAGGPGPRDLFDFTSLGVQTGILLFSSFTVGLASLALKYDQGRSHITLWLLVTLALGIVFLSLEIHDFTMMIAQGGRPTRSGYLSAFFATVALHGLHVFMGCLWLITLLLQMFTLGLIKPIKTRMMRFALFWHFLDLIWIGIFSIVYFGGWIYG